MFVSDWKMIEVCGSMMTKSCDSISYDILSDRWMTCDFTLTFTFVQYFSHIRTMRG